ncbi:MAG: hypothetical protein V8Q75_06295 [Bacilli bacterium]
MENKNITFDDIKKANDTIKTLPITRTDKQTGKKVTKKYAEVNQRIKAFRMVYPTGTIETTLVSDIDGTCTFRADIYDGDKLLATGTARENSKSSFINQTNYIENCETSAVGRALGMCGFGVDASLSSAEEVQNAIVKQEKMENGPMTEEQAFIIADLTPEQKETLRNFYKKDVMKLTKQEAENSINSLQKKGLIKTKEEKELEKKVKEEVF